VVRGAQTRLSSLFFFRRRVGPSYVFASLYSFSTLSLGRFSLRIGCRLLCTSSFRTSILVRWLILFINLKHLFELSHTVWCSYSSITQSAHFQRLGIVWINRIQVSLSLMLLISVFWFVSAINKGTICCFYQSSNFESFLAIHLPSVTLLVLYLFQLALNVCLSFIHTLLVPHEHKILAFNIGEHWCNSISLILIPMGQFSYLHIEYSIVRWYFLPLIFLQNIVQITPV